MGGIGLSDLDALVLRCVGKKARSFLGEAVACFKAGAFRASIVATWVAVVFDYLAKLEELALLSDTKAQKKLEEFKKIARSGDVGGALRFERTVLVSAKDEFEFVGPIAYGDLLRLQEDRNRCAHPSMIDAENDYQPAPEAARLHIVNAVRHLLEHGPAQGKVAIDRLLEELGSAFFPGSVDELVVHLRSGPLGRPRDTLVRNYALVLLKELLLQPPVESTNLLEQLTGSWERSKRRDRLLLSLEAVIALHREKTYEFLTEKFNDLVSKCDERNLEAALGLLCRLRDLGSLLQEAERGRLKRYVRAMPAGDLGSTLPLARTLDFLVDEAKWRFSVASGVDWVHLGCATSTPSVWIDEAVAKMAVADEWKPVNDIAKGFLIPNVGLVNQSHVQTLLRASKTNYQLRSSWGFTDLLKEITSLKGPVGDSVVALAKEEDLDEELSKLAWWPAQTALPIQTDGVRSKPDGT
jgi:hypothetical protein